MEAADYNSCEWCHGLYRPRQLWRHKKCSVKPSKSILSCVRKVASGWMVSSDILSEVKSLISGIQAGPERLVVQNDHLLQTLAGRLLQRVAQSKHHINYIRSRL